MGCGFWVLLFDDFGSGLNLINPRFFIDEKGNNWFPTQDSSEESQAKLITKLGLNKLGCKYRLID